MGNAVGFGDVAVDECGNAFVLLTQLPQEENATTLWYVPLVGGAYELNRYTGRAVTNLQWGNGRFGWDASSLYVWVWDDIMSARLHRIDVGVGGNHVLTR